MTMIEVQEAVFNLLHGVHTHVYMEQVPEDDETCYPQTTYQFSSFSPAELHEDIFLTIDVWDNKADDTMPIEGLASAFNDVLDKQSIRLTGGFIRLHRIPGAYMIPDPDLQLRRRQMRYRIKFYKVG